VTFRASVDDWLAQMLPADLYLRASSAGASGFLTPEVVARAAALPGVAAARPVRYDTLRLSDERVPVTLIARAVAGGIALPLVAGVGGDAARRQGGLPPVWISEAVAELFGLGVGDTLALPLGGARIASGSPASGATTRVSAALVVELADYRARTGDTHRQRRHTSASPPQRHGRGGERGAARRTGRTHRRITQPGEIRAITLAIFDRTFLVT
jgi:putative ABC transport system permease protein